VISPDGQAILFGRNLAFAEGEFFSLQATTSIPEPPAWPTVVGQGYRITANRSIPSDVSISFNYLGGEVPAGEESGLRVYYWSEEGWQVLPTSLNLAQNNASAPTRGAGLYALMSSVEIPLYGPDWNNFAYLVQEERPVREALRSIEGSYTTVCTYDPTDSNGPWLIFDINQPDELNTLDTLKFGHGYLIYVTQNVILRLRGPISSPPPALSSPVAPPPPGCPGGS
jgi:hypothetical protein